MDARRFDALARALRPGSRRGLLGLLLTLPVFGGLLAILGFEETDAKGRRKRRKKRHKHGKGNGRRRKNKRKKRCKRKSRARICRGKCGIVKNRKTCKKKVDCGACVACSDTRPCPDGCCAGNGSCQPGTTPEFCGVVGGACQACAATQLCRAGSCQPCDVCDGDCRYSTIQAAVADVDGPATIQVCAGIYQDAPIPVTRSLTLIGAGAEQTILAGHGPDGGRVLAIHSGIVFTVQDLTVTDGQGGILNGGDLTLIGVTVRGNTNSQRGGGINNAGGTLTLENGTRIAGNTATVTGGGIYNEATLILEAGSIVGGDTEADANTATEDGGGIFNSSLGTLTLADGSQVAGNTATRDGGGIFNNGEVTLENGSQVAGNTAMRAGGGIDNVGGTLTLEAGSRVAGNTAATDGGGISNGGSGTVTLQAGSVVGGDAPADANTAENGGGIYTSSLGEVTLEADSHVTGNTATDEGGGIFNFDGEVTVEIGAFVCDNEPPDDQCAGPSPIANCPTPAEECPG